MAECLKDRYGPFKAQENEESTLSERCNKIWDISFANLKPSDIRLLIDQSIGLDDVVPIAIGILEENPLIEAEFYRGDLLKAVFGISKEYWSRHDELFVRAVELKSEIEILKDTLVNEILPSASEIKF